MIQRLIAPVWHRFQQVRLEFMQWSGRNPQTHLLLVHLRRAVTNFIQYDARRAAALAYYAVFSIFPLTLLLAIGISRVLDTAIAQQQISNALNLFLPEANLTALLVDNIDTAMSQNTSFGLVALVGLCWSGLGVFTNMTSSLDLIFRVPQNRSLWRQRLMALAMVVMLVGLVATSFIVSGAIALLNLLTANAPSTWLRMAAIFLPLGLNMMIFLLLFRYVPARPVHWDAIWPAAFIGAGGFELARQGFGWYLTNLANFQVVYGSITTVIVLLLWTYVMSSVFLFSAEVCAQMNEWLDVREEKSQTLLLPAHLLKTERFE